MPRLRTTRGRTRAATVASAGYAACVHASAPTELQKIAFASTAARIVAQAPTHVQVVAQRRRRAVPARARLRRAAEVRRVEHALERVEARLVECGHGRCERLRERRPQDDRNLAGRENGPGVDPAIDPVDREADG